MGICHFEKKLYFVSLIRLDEPIRSKFGTNTESIVIKRTKSYNYVLIKNWPFAHAQNLQNINELWNPINKSD